MTHRGDVQKTNPLEHVFTGNLGFDPVETRRLYNILFAELDIDPHGCESIPHEIVMAEADALVERLARERTIHGRR